MNADLIALMDPLARRFFGEPNPHLSKKGANELRFGSNGSLKVDLKNGRWFDFEANQGGGVLDLIKREVHCASERECFEWLEHEGLWTNGGTKPRRDNARKVVVATFLYSDRDDVLRFAVERVEFQKPDGSFVLT